jgi:phosphatidylglycerol---prolipoprotein diacylglyceryl transferase
MQPHLFTIPGVLNLQGYGTLILIGGLVSIAGVYRDLRARGIGKPPLSALVDLYLVLVVGAFVGGRVAHVLTAPGGPTSASLLDPEGTGFVFFGSLTAVVLGLFWLARRHHTRVLVLSDVALTWMPLGHAFGRLGCLLAGCCFGAPTDAPWGLSFPSASMAFALGEVPHAGEHTVPLHPTQLYEALGLFALWGWTWSRRRAGIETPGRQVARYALGYGVLRAVVEVFRGDPSRGMLASISVPAIARALGLPEDQPLVLSVSQAVALGLVALGAWGLLRTRRPGGVFSAADGDRRRPESR